MNSETNRRFFLQAGTAAASLCLFDLHDMLAAEGVPQSVAELWADFDPRQDPPETEVIREFKEDGAVIRHVRFLVGTFKGKPARLTAIYGFPEGAKEKLPAVMHIHGGGQRAFLHEPFNSPEGAQPGDPNTDWGAVDPSQLNATRHDSIQPGPLQVFEDREHPKNNNWYLLALGCRRGLTFLEQQPQVDATFTAGWTTSIGPTPSSWITRRWPRLPRAALGPQGLPGRAVLVAAETKSG